MFFLTWGSLQHRWSSTAETRDVASRTSRYSPTKLVHQVIFAALPRNRSSSHGSPPWVLRQFRDGEHPKSICLHHEGCILSETKRFGLFGLWIHMELRWISEDIIDSYGFMRFKELSHWYINRIFEVPPFSTWIHKVNNALDQRKGGGRGDRDSGRDRRDGRDRDRRYSRSRSRSRRWARSLAVWWMKWQERELMQHDLVICSYSSHFIGTW